MQLVESDRKTFVRVATTSNIVLSGLQTVDGILLAVDETVLVKDQTLPLENGIYFVKSGTWNRAPMVAGSLILVEKGTVHADSLWALTTNLPLEVGGSSLVFSELTESGAVAAAAKVTTGNITIPVDYNLSSAVDPPAGLVFTSQADVDSYLASQGSTAFKHLQLVYDALPLFISHAITFNLAAGVHRPLSAQDLPAAWLLDRKFIRFSNAEGILGRIDIIGAAPSLYTPRPGVATNIAITGFQSATRDPWIDVSGTPFTVAAWAGTTLYVAGDRVQNGGNTYVCRIGGTSAGAGGPTGTAITDIVDGTVTWRFETVGTAYLNGSTAVLSTGQAVLIHDHTASRLFVTNVITPSPVGGTVSFIGRPSTILRNSINDTTNHRTITLVTSANVPRNAPTAAAASEGILLQDIAIDHFGGGANVVLARAGSLTFTRSIFDQDSMIDAPFNRTPTGTSISHFEGGQAPIQLNFCASINRQVTGGPPNWGNGDGPYQALGCYFKGAQGGLENNDQSRQGQLLTGVVFDSVGQGVLDTGSAILSLSRSLQLRDPGTAGFQGAGKDNEFRNAKTGTPSITLRRSHMVTLMRATFKTCGGPCVRVSSDAAITLTGTNVLLNGGGNTDVGIEFTRKNAGVDLTTGTTVTGSAGDVRIGGQIVSYTTITANGGVTDLANLQSISRV